MHVLIAPTSGGMFPSQITLLMESVEARKRANLPNYEVALAASGGNVAVYAAQAGNFNYREVTNILSRISSTNFLTSWWNSPLSSILPSWLLGYSRGSLYNQGRGIEELFEDFYSHGNITQLEIWTTAFNKTQDKIEIFTNISSGQSKLATGYYRPCQYNTLPLRYLHGNVRRIARACYASAAITGLVPHVDIFGDSTLYADGGSVFSSPLTPLSGVLDKTARFNHPDYQDILYSIPVKSREIQPPQSLHLDYVSCQDIEASRNLKPGTILTSGLESYQELMRSLHLQDRLHGIQLVGRCRYFEAGRCDRKILTKLMQRRQHYARSFLEIYPTNSQAVPLTSFTSSQIIDKMELARLSFNYRLWYY